LQPAALVPREKMSLTKRYSPDANRPRTTGFVGRLDESATRFIAGTAEGTIVLTALLAFALLWTIFDVVSLTTVDAHPDVSEAILWARNFAFGYKHPPLTAWLYMAWFAVFPRQDWAADLLNVAVVTIGLAVTWRLLRDHLDRNRALLGLFALMLIPLYDVKTAILNANTVMIPFWAAALLFYLRARRGLGFLEAFLGGAFASLAVLGKYWALFLVAGMAVAALTGPGTKRFWRSGAPLVMALGAAIVMAPHAWWFIEQRGGTNYVFIRDTVVVAQSFGEALLRSARYLINCVAYAIVPIIFLLLLRPSKAALAGMAWPSDEDRRQIALLFLVPLLLPAVVNLVLPYRLTADWTYPNWALLPAVLYAGRELAVDERAAGRAGLVALAATLALVVISPVIAGVRLTKAQDQYRAHFRDVAESADSTNGKPVRLYWGTPDIADGLAFYLPGAQRLSADPSSAEGQSAARRYGLLVVCLPADAPCLKVADALTTAGAPTRTATLTRHFLWLAGPPLTVRITVAPPDQVPARAAD
jgi:4-amino-4-deoxy-L-arabinose transferase-like glycosyltransferase